MVIPAHNEEAVVGSVIGDVLGADYPRELLEVWVLADRCSDQTASVARTAGARVAERTDGPAGKGQLLGWFFKQVEIGPEQTLVVFDSDNRVPKDFFGRVADEMDSGKKVVQVYLDAPDRNGSWVSTASAMTYWAGNRMIQLARSNLGWSADLGGTGMCFSGEVVAAAGGFGESLVEDNELAVRLALDGIKVTWLHHLRILDEKPAEVSVAVRQRARWKAGKRSVRRKYWRALVGEGIRRRKWALFDQALRLVQPSRTVLALTTGLFLALALFGFDWVFPWGIWATLGFLQFFTPVAFLRRDGFSWSVVSRYPLLVGLALLWFPVTLLSHKVANWYHTPHGRVSGNG